MHIVDNICIYIRICIHATPSEGNLVVDMSLETPGLACDGGTCLSFRGLCVRGFGRFSQFWVYAAGEYLEDRMGFAKKIRAVCLKIGCSADNQLRSAWPPE